MGLSNGATYIIRNNHTFCFRMKVPSDLHTTLLKKELRYSLKTDNLSEAKIKAGFVAGKVQLLFRDVRKGRLNKMKLTDEQIKAMIQNFMRKIIQEYDEPVIYSSLDEDPQREAYWDGKSINDELSFLDDRIEDHRIYIQRGDYSLYEEDADTLLNTEGISDSEINKASPAYAKLCTGIINAVIQGIKYQQQKLIGNDPGHMDNFPSAGIQPSLTPDKGSSATIPTETNPKKKITVMTLIQKYIAEGKRVKRWTGKTPSEIESALNVFAEIIGKTTTVASIDKDLLLDYKEKMLRLPPLNQLPKEHRGKSTLELLQIEHEQTIQIKTFNKRMEFTLNFLNYAEDENILQPFPRRGLKIKETRKNSEKRDAFNKEDLVKIFHSKEYTQDSFNLYYRFWGPILGVFTGARLDEISQALLTDFIEQDGVHCLRVYTSEDTKTKTTSSERLIPLHPFLVEDLKIMDRVERLKNRGEERFFHTFSKSKDGYGRTLGRWFNDYLKPIDVYIKYKKTFHSFRHTFTTNLYHNGIREADSRFLDGHSQDGVTFDTYLKAGKMSRLHEVLVNHLDYGIDLSHLKNSKYVVK